jgi:hypothetical protein
MTVESKPKLAPVYPRRGGGSALSRQAMRTVLATAFLFGVLCMNVSGKIAGFSLEKSLKEADIIAHIRIISDVEIIPYTPKLDPREFRRIATATALTPLKGCKAGDTIKLNHTNGFGCPNVIYRTEGEYIVFLRKSSDEGRFDTMNLYAGQFPIEDGMVLGFYLLRGYRYQHDLRLPLSRVLDFLSNEVKTQG